MDLITENYSLDALPYTELPLTEDEEMLVSQMIQEEIQNFEPQDYLSVFQPVPEERKIPASRGDDDEGLDFEKYELDHPVFDDNDSFEKRVEVWQDLIERAKIQIQHQSIRITNLQLLDQFGQTAWLDHLQELEKAKNVLKKILQTRQSQLTELNEERQRRQFDWAGELARNDTKWKQLLQENYQIEQEVKKLLGERKD